MLVPEPIRPHQPPRWQTRPRNRRRATRCRKTRPSPTGSHPPNPASPRTTRSVNRIRVHPRRVLVLVPILPPQGFRASQTLRKHRCRRPRSQYQRSIPPIRCPIRLPGNRSQLIVPNRRRPTRLQVNRRRRPLRRRTMVQRRRHPGHLRIDSNRRRRLCRCRTRPLLRRIRPKVRPTPLLPSRPPPRQLRPSAHRRPMRPLPTPDLARPCPRPRQRRPRSPRIRHRRAIRHKRRRLRHRWRLVQCQDLVQSRHPLLLSAPPALGRRTWLRIPRAVPAQRRHRCPPSRLVPRNPLVRRIPLVLSRTLRRTQHARHRRARPQRSRPVRCRAVPPLLRAHNARQRSSRLEQMLPKHQCVRTGGTVTIPIRPIAPRPRTPRQTIPQPMVFPIPAARSGHATITPPSNGPKKPTTSSARATTTSTTSPST